MDLKSSTWADMRYLEGEELGSPQRLAKFGPHSIKGTCPALSVVGRLSPTIDVIGYLEGGKLSEVQTTNHHEATNPSPPKRKVVMIFVKGI